MQRPPVQPAIAPPRAVAAGSGERSIECCSALAAAGDQAAIAELHERLSAGLVRHFARKLDRATGGGPDAAEELAQQTWLIFWQAICNRQYDPMRAKLSTFLYAIAANVWLRHARQSGRDSRVRAAGIGGYDRADGADGADGGDGGDWPLTGSCDEPAAVMHAAALLDAVRSAVDGTLVHPAGPGTGAFAEPERELLRAIGQGLTDRQLAAELGVSPSTAHARKRGVLARLALVLRSHGFAGPEGFSSPEGELAQVGDEGNGLKRAGEPTGAGRGEEGGILRRGPQLFHTETKQLRLGAP